MVLSVHCPFVIMLKEAIAAIANEYTSKGINFVGLSSNSTQTHPQDGPEGMRKDAAQYGFDFPYLFDEDQSLARALGAMCTPDFYLFSAEGALIYHGRFDDATPGNSKSVTGRDLKAALDAVAAGAVDFPGAKPSMGCSLKWNPGQEPEYFLSA